MALIEDYQLLALGRHRGQLRADAGQIILIAFPKAIKIGMITLGTFVLMSRLLNRLITDPSDAVSGRCSTPFGTCTPVQYC